MSDRMAEIDMARLVQKLCVAFGKPFGAAADAQVGLWYEQLEQYPRSAVEAAIDRIIKQDQRFPTVAKVRLLVQESLPTRTYLVTDEPTCPVCRTAFFYAGYEVGTLRENKRQDTGRVIPRLRCRCKPVGNGWHTEKAKAWRPEVAGLLPSA